MNKTVYVAGHQGMVGSALCRHISKTQKASIVTRTRAELDLTNQAEVGAFFQNQSIDEVYLAAAKVGGIHANNSYPGEFIFDNLMVQCNVINAAYQAGIKKLLFLGSSCIYPRAVSQPMSELALLSDALEPTNEPYAVAKIAGIKLCESYNRQYGLDYRSVMPTNLYGQNDNFHSENSHVIPALMRRIHDAKVSGQESVTIWGSGKPMREFLHVDDMASACVHLMELPSHQYTNIVDDRCSHVNIGTGQDCSIEELARTLSSVIEYQGNLLFDSSKPDGAPRKLLNVQRLNELGWQASIDLKVGLQATYEWFVNNEHELRGVN